MPIPSFTLQPSRSSCAARSARCSRDHGIAPPLAHGALLNPLAIAVALNDPLHENPGRVDMVGIERAALHKLLDPRPCDTARRRHHRIEVTGGLAIDQIAFGPE